jgi:hypothetical protein
MMNIMGRPVVCVAVLGGLLVLTACGSQRAGQGGAADRSAAEPPADIVPDDYTGRFRGTSVTVLSSPAHGPQLCSFLAESYPPQCEGPDIVGWDWSAVEHESASGTSWGTYDVVGTFEDGVFTLTEPPSPPSPPTSDRPTPSSVSPDPPTERELNRIADQISGTPGTITVGSDTRRGKVMVGAWVATESLWRRLTEEHDPEIIELVGILQPLDERQPRHN